MAFNDDQIEQLNAPLNRAQVKEREQGGRKFSYVESWHCIAEANRIFHFDGWSSETTELKCVCERERQIGKPPNTRDGWGVTYTAKVKVTVGDVVREDVGAGHGIDTDVGLAHESAIKEAVSDAQKRALRTFGNVFGLALYDKSQSNVVDESELRRQSELAARRHSFLEHCKAEIATFRSRDEIAAWWQTDGMKSSRRRFELSAADVEMLKAHMVARATALEQGGRNAATS